VSRHTSLSSFLYLSHSAKPPRLCLSHWKGQFQVDEVSTRNGDWYHRLPDFVLRRSLWLFSLTLCPRGLYRCFLFNHPVRLFCIRFGFAGVCLVRQSEQSVRVPEQRADVKWSRDGQRNLRRARPNSWIRTSLLQAPPAQKLAPRKEPSRGLLLRFVLADDFVRVKIIAPLRCHEGSASNADQGGAIPPLWRRDLLFLQGTASFWQSSVSGRAKKNKAGENGRSVNLRLRPNPRYIQVVASLPERPFCRPPIPMCSLDSRT